MVLYLKVSCLCSNSRQMWCMIWTIVVAESWQVQQWMGGLLNVWKSTCSVIVVWALLIVSISLHFLLRGRSLAWWSQNSNWKTGCLFLLWMLQLFFLLKIWRPTPFWWLFYSSLIHIKRRLWVWMEVVQLLQGANFGSVPAGLWRLSSGPRSMCWCMVSSKLLLRAREVHFFKPAWLHMKRTERCACWLTTKLLCNVFIVACGLVSGVEIFFPYWHYIRMLLVDGSSCAWIPSHDKVPRWRPPEGWLDVLRCRMLNAKADASAADLTGQFRQVIATCLSQHREAVVWAGEAWKAQLKGSLPYWQVLLEHEPRQNRSFEWAFAASSAAWVVLFLTWTCPPVCSVQRAPAQRWQFRRLNYFTSVRSRLTSSSNPIHYTTLHYTTLHYTEWHCTTDRQVDR